ncbi:MAG: Glu/Leu/Phe/Val dehydrogenase dimerization domain-containing protein [Azospirillaceae bacterium]
MAVFDQTDFDAHEQLVFASDVETGLRAIIAIHDTTRGPALGGCRMWAYASEQDAIRDALRLSRGMTYKAAISDLPLGGGKSVIIGDARRHKTPAMMRAMGAAVERLAGRYIVAEDVGTSVEDMAEIARTTGHVVGLDTSASGTGDPSPATAFGVFRGLEAAIAFSDAVDTLQGATVAVQGLGHVGYHLCRYLAEAGARLIVTDIHQQAIDRVVKAFGARAVAADAIYDVEADVYAPCALGATINNTTINRLRVKIVAGSANNQLATPSHGEALRRRGILYAPDYVINAGGLMNVAAERFGYGADATWARIAAIHDTTLSILERARRDGIPSSDAADRIAEERFRSHRQALAA